jgi:hypothetical protein
VDVGPSRRPRRRWLVAGAVLTVAGVVLAACTASPPPQPVEVTVAVTPTPTPSPTPTPAPPDPYPGAAWLVEGGGELPDVPYTPNGAVASRDRPVTYDTGCHTRTVHLQHCEFGPANAAHTIALVGDSHSAHWLPGLQSIAEEFGFHIVSVTKSGCRFAVYPSDSYAACQSWNIQARNYLTELKPDLVLTLATVGSSGADSFRYGTFYPQWEALEEAGIPIIAIRDTPWFDYNVAGCVLTYGPDAERCGADKAFHGLTKPVLVPEESPLPSNVHLLDLTYLFCDETLCPAVVGNVLVYRDDHHLSATYVKTAAPYLAQHILDLMGWQKP